MSSSTWFDSSVPLPVRYADNRMKLLRDRFCALGGEMNLFLGCVPGGDLGIGVLGFFPSSLMGYLGASLEKLRLMSPFLSKCDCRGKVSLRI